MKRLYLLRHAKSSWDDPELRDHDRPLAPRGRKAAKSMADYMKANGYRPALILCSSATRARQTMDLAAGWLKHDAAVEIDAGIYDTGAPGELVEIISRAPPEAESVLVIGHNPVMQELALVLLAEGEPVAPIRRKLPTAALVVLDLPIEGWTGLEPGTASLADYRTPKQLNT